MNVQKNGRCVRTLKNLKLYIIHKQQEISILLKKKCSGSKKKLEKDFGIYSFVKKELLFQ
jgi:hypothetical protein